MAFTPPGVTSIRKDVPKKLSKIIEICMEKESHKRYSTINGIEYDILKVKAEWKAMNEMQLRSDTLADENQEKEFFFSLRTKDCEDEEHNETKLAMPMNFNNFIGREKETEIMREAIARSLNHETTVVLVSGPSGVGLFMLFVQKQTKRLSDGIIHFFLQIHKRKN